MRYKILLTGKNNAVINDFFLQMDDDFEALTTSLRYEDILNHVTYIRPDVFCYCLFNETLDDLKRIGQVKSTLDKYNIPTIIIGSEMDCSEFARATTWAANLMINTPMKAAHIASRIIRYLNRREDGEPEMPVSVDPFENALENSPNNSILSGFENISAGGAADSSFPQSANPAPSAPHSEASEIDQIFHSMQPGAGPTIKTNSARKHILVVDDNPIMLKTIKEHLHDKYDVATAISGKVALKFLQKKKTDLILLDYEMPDENGAEVLKRLRSDVLTKDIPVIFLTGITERNKIAQVLVLKPQGYLLKPVDHNKLLETISKVLGV